MLLPSARSTDSCERHLCALSGPILPLIDPEPPTSTLFLEDKWYRPPFSHLPPAVPLPPLCKNPDHLHHSHRILDPCTTSLGPAFSRIPLWRQLLNPQGLHLNYNWGSPSLPVAGHVIHTPKPAQHCCTTWEIVALLSSEVGYKNYYLSLSLVL